MKILFSSLQWLAFTMAGSIVAPLAIGSSFQLSPAEIASLMQRTFFIIGIASLLQVLLGHRLPIREGPAGLWWGVFIVYAGLVGSGALSLEDGLAQLEMGLLISGVLFVLLGLLKWVDKIKVIFTPLVVGTYLILLVAQLSGSFIKGILGVGYLTDKVDLKVAVSALCILILAFIMAKSSISILRNYSVLISLFIGWLLFIFLGINKPASFSAVGFSVPAPLQWGPPQFSFGVTLTSIFIGLLLLANMIASINVIENVVTRYGEKVSKANYNRSSFIMGINTSLAGLFSAVGCVPIAASAGFMLTTNNVTRLPFIISSFMMIGISFFPVLTSLFASIPVPVGYATLFVSFATLVGIGLREYRSLELNDKNLFIIGVSMMVGIGSLFIPPEAIVSLPGLLQTIINNGLVIGMITCIVLEQGMKWLGKMNQHS